MEQASASGAVAVARYPLTALTAFIVAVLVRVGLTPDDAAQMAAVLLAADEHGVDSHGISHLRLYAERLASGLTNPRPRVTVVHETPGALVLDGDNGPGPVVGAEAMRRCLAKALDHGVATVTMRHSNHYGALLYYPLLAASEGMAGMTMTTTGPFVLPTFGAAGILGSNPICIAFPAGAHEPPFLIDMSTSVVAYGKLEIARREGRPIPEGWAFDEQMQPTTDPVRARSLSTLGGDRDHGGQKGYGLNVAVDLFAGLLSGGRVSAENAQNDAAAEATHTSHMWSAWRIDAFVPIDQYRARFDEYVGLLRSCPPAAGHARVLVPGDPEWAAAADRRANGVPLHPAVASDLARLGSELGVPFGA